MKLEKGNVIKTDLSDNTIVLDMDNKQKQAVLFTGNQFVIVSGIKENKESGKFEWDNGRYANDIKTITEMQNNSFETMKETVSFLTEYNHRDFTKALISIETGIENEDVLDNAYDEYMENDAMTLIDNQFYDYVDESGLEKAIVEKEQEKVTEQKSEKHKTINVKGDFVKLSGQEKKTTCKDGKEYIRLKVNEANLLKAKQQTKQKIKENDRSSVMGKLNKYKQKANDKTSKNVKN